MATQDQSSDLTTVASWAGLSEKVPLSCLSSNLGDSTDLVKARRENSLQLAEIENRRRLGNFSVVSNVRERQAAEMSPKVG